MKDVHHGSSGSALLPRDLQHIHMPGKKKTRGGGQALRLGPVRPGYVQYTHNKKTATRGKRKTQKDESLVIGSVVGPQTEPPRGHPLHHARAQPPS